MSILFDTHWDVRTGGNDLNGGGYLPGSSGVDYSAQNSPQLSNTDLAIDASDNTKVSSAGSPFTSQHVGNLFQVSAGSGFTTGFYRVVSVASGVATCDRAVGTTSSTGGTFRLGGGLLTLSKAFTAIDSSSGDFVHVKSGTYTYTSEISTPGSGIIGATFIGYGTVHFDFAATPLVTTSTNSTRFLSPGGNVLGLGFLNFDFSNTAGTTADCFRATTGGGDRDDLFFYKCSFTGFFTAVRGDFNGDYYWHCLTMVGCEISNSTYGIYNGAGNNVLIGCHIHDCTEGFYDDTGIPGVNTFLRTIFRANTRGVHQNSTTAQRTTSVLNCIFDSNTNDGIRKTGGSNPINWTIMDTIFSNNGGYAFNLVSVNTAGRITRIRCAFYSNTSGNLNNLRSDATDIILSVDPFTATGTDYSLNATAGGGAALVQLAFPGTIPNAGLGYLDIGALNNAATGGGGGGGAGLMVHPGMVGGIRG